MISFDGTAEGAPDGDDVGKGSGRSVKGLNLVEALTDSEDLLERFGGHELAAGLSIRRCNIDEFRRKINRYAAAHLSEEMLCVCLDVDCEVEMRDLTMKLAGEINRMEPFGIANPIPTFVLRDARILRMMPMGGGKHLRLLVEKDGVEMTAVWFGTGPLQIPFAIGDCVDLLFQLNVNEFQGVTSLQMILQDMKYAESFERDYQKQVARYEEVHGGAFYTKHEELLPSRDDIAVVYTLLRREFRGGQTTFPMRRLLALIASDRRMQMGYGKLKFILRIMQELNLCRINEPEHDVYVFGFDYQATKTNIEKSSILRKLRLQMRGE